jgi:hypothetical protein
MKQPYFISPIYQALILYLFDKEVTILLFLYNQIHFLTYSINMKADDLLLYSNSLGKLLINKYLLSHVFILVKPYQIENNQQMTYSFYI